MHLDKKGRLWLKCQENRMGYFNTSDFKFHEVAVRYPQLALRDAGTSFTKDVDGNMMLVLGRSPDPTQTFFNNPSSILPIQVLLPAFCTCIIYIWITNRYIAQISSYLVFILLLQGQTYAPSS
jgi:hypothetical protein